MEQNKSDATLDSDEICSLVGALYIEIHTSHKRASQANKDLIAGLNQQIKRLEDENTLLSEELHDLKTSKLIEKRQNKNEKE